MRRCDLAFTEEEREALLKGLGLLLAELRSRAKPGPRNRESYDPQAARQYRLAEELRNRIEVAL